MSEHVPVLECQDCGDVVVKRLTPKQLEAVIARPYDFVVYCRTCRIHH